MKKVLILFFIISFNGFSQIDTDGDGVNDDVDNCPTVANEYSTEGTTVAGGNGEGSASNQLYDPYAIIMDCHGSPMGSTDSLWPYGFPVGFL